MRFFLLSKVDGSAAVSLGFADDFKEGYWDQPPGGRDKGIARLVPIWVVLPANNVEKISLAEGQFLSIPWFGLVIVERLDDLYAFERRLININRGKEGVGKQWDGPKEGGNKEGREVNAETYRKQQKGWRTEGKGKG